MATATQSLPTYWHDTWLHVAAHSATAVEFDALGAILIPTRLPLDQYLLRG
jgi:hypothetical protein